MLVKIDTSQSEEELKKEEGNSPWFSSLIRGLANSLDESKLSTFEWLVGDTTNLLLHNAVHAFLNDEGGFNEYCKNVLWQFYQDKCF